MSNCDHTELYIHEPTRYYRAPCPWCAINKADALTQTVAELRAERERLKAATNSICGWACMLAHKVHMRRLTHPSYWQSYDLARELADDTGAVALASPPATVDPAEAEKLHREGVVLANLFRQIQPSRDAEEPPVQKRAKGSYGAECNRASCKTVLATWKHRDMDRYYCSACGMWINENNSDCDPPLCGPVAGDAT